MNPSELKELLHQLNNKDRLIVLAYVIRHWVNHKARLLARLHPSRLVLPIAAMQIIFFIFAVGTTHNIIATLAVGNLTITALAMLPTLTQKKAKPTGYTRMKKDWIHGPRS